MTANRRVLRHINLYQVEFRPARVPLPASRMLAGLGLLLLGLLAVWGWGLAQNRALEAEVARVGRQTEALEGRLNALDKGRPAAGPVSAEAIRRLEARLAGLSRAEQDIRSGAAGSMQGWSAQFDALARVRVSGLWLTGVSLEGHPPVMTLRGRTLDGTSPARYIAQLRRQPQLAGLEFAALEIAEPETKPGPPAADTPDKTPRYLEFHLSGPARQPATQAADTPPGRQP